MKKILYIIAASAVLVALSGCESYLDRQPDDQLTSKNIFDKKASTLAYLYNVYYYIPNVTDPSGQSTIYMCTSDELSLPYPNRVFTAITHDNFSPLSTFGNYRNYSYKYLYYGIREATFFMENVGKCPELTAEETAKYYAEARFLRAWYYTELLRLNGPVVFLGDNLADFTDPNLAGYDRTPWQTIVNWLCDEYDLAASDLPADPFLNPSEIGRATKGAALAMKARLLMYNARPLFNGQNGTGIYDNVVNNKGEKLFNTTYDEDRWRQAAAAAKAVIDMNTYKLVDEDGVEPIVNIHNEFMSMNSPENIFARQKEAYSFRVVCAPAGIGGTSYGGCSPTQKLVDAFAMSNGYYPVKNIDEASYENGLGSVEFDSRADYQETGSTSFVNPFFQKLAQNSQTAAIETPNMYVHREPRFYANIFWSGQTWVAGQVTKKDIQLYKKGANGPETSNNYSTTGYLALKFVDPNQSTTQGGSATSTWGTISWPIIRYADILLMYIEALNEYDPTNPEILLYWNKIRKRAGVPSIGTEEGEIYSEIIGDQALQRKYIRQERFVELCFEGTRYFDTRTWMTAEQEDNGEVVGCNVAASNDDIGKEFWTRTSIFKTYGEGGITTDRVFTKKHYLLPINQEELDRCPDMTQNYGW